MEATAAELTADEEICHFHLFCFGVMVTGEEPKVMEFYHIFLVTRVVLRPNCVLLLTRKQWYSHYGGH